MFWMTASLTADWPRAMKQYEMFRLVLDDRFFDSGLALIDRTPRRGRSVLDDRFFDSGLAHHLSGSCWLPFWMTASLTADWPTKSFQLGVETVLDDRFFDSGLALTLSMVHSPSCSG